VDALERFGERRGHAGRRAAGQHEPVERHALAAVELDLPCGEIERPRPVAEPPVGVEVLGDPEGDVLARRLARQELLRQRGTVVGRMRLLPHHDELALEALGAQRLGRPQAGQGRPDDDDAAHASALDRDRLHGAEVHGLLDLRPQGLVHVGLVVEVALLVEREDLGGGELALPVAVAYVEVDVDLHRYS
jgi:hypothetical protein